MESTSVQPLNHDDPDLYERETRCGFEHFHPNWLQKLASKKSYVIVYGLIGMYDMAIGAYHSATISTIEKSFKMSSQTTGIIGTMTEIGATTATLVFSYLGSKRHKTRWLACGTFVVGLSCFMRIIPYLIYGPGEDALRLTEEYERFHGIEHNSTTITGSFTTPLCNDGLVDEDCSVESSSIIPVLLFMVTALIIGIGNSMYHTLGIAYLDDNARKDKSPFLLAIWQFVRMLGPTFGYMFGSYTLSKYVDLSVQPTITNEDPRWIGAWWLGWSPLGIIGFMLALMVSCFPKMLPRTAQRKIMAGEKIEQADPWSISDFIQTMLRLARNKIFMLNTFSTVVFMFGMTGYMAFMPKYMETQFRQTASDSSFITGSIGLIASGLGVLASGAVITVFKPRARYLAAWNVIVEALDMVGYFIYGFLSCTVDDLHGAMNPDHSWNLSSACNNDCNCGPSVQYSPVCDMESTTTFFSACHAGCTTVEMINGTKVYANCSCIGENGFGSALDGPCPFDCTTYFTIFIVLMSLSKFLSASGRAGNFIVQFRCIKEEDKSLSVAFVEALLCGLAFLPGAVVYGILLDSACIVWEETCGETGNCWLYDGKKLGFLVNFTASVFLLGGTLLDVGVWYYVKGLQIYDDDDDDEGKNNVDVTKERD